MIERTPLLLEYKKFAFYGGKYNTHTPRERAWLPKRLRPIHSDAPRPEAREPKPQRPGDPLRDEPLVRGAEKAARTSARRRAQKAAAGRLDADVDLARTSLLLDHDKST